MMPSINELKISVYFILTVVVLILSFFPEGLLLYFLIRLDGMEIGHYLLAPVYFFLSYCITVLLFGIIHSQLVVRLTLPYSIEPGVYSRDSSIGRMVAVRITADGIFKSMLKVFTALPFIWGVILFPKLMRLYGLKTGKNVHITTRTYIETAGLVEIGDNSFIGYNSVVTGHVNEGGNIIVSPTKIGRNCMVGTYCIIACGCEMGDNSILGAKSAIKKGQKIPPNEIWVGLPAKKLRNRGESINSNR